MNWKTKNHAPPSPPSTNDKTTTYRPYTGYYSQTGGQGPPTTTSPSPWTRTYRPPDPTTNWKTKNYGPPSSPFTTYRTTTIQSYTRHSQTSGTVYTGQPSSRHTSTRATVYPPTATTKRSMTHGPPGWTSTIWNTEVPTDKSTYDTRHQDTYTQLLINMLLTICPEVTTCNDSFTDELRMFHIDSESCCIPCSCEDDCVVTGNCCTEKQINLRNETAFKPKSLRGEQCMTSTYSSQTQPGYDRTYLMVADCLVNSESCWDGDSPFNIYLETPVFSVNSTLSYRNELCALCNSENGSNLIYWDIILTCDTYTELQRILRLSASVVHFSKIVSDSCSLIWSPPSNLVKPCFRRNTSMVATCDTNYVSEQNIMLAYKCQNNPQTLFGRYEHKIYMNAHCFICSDEFAYGNLYLTNGNICNQLTDRYDLEHFGATVGYAQLQSYFRSKIYSYYTKDQLNQTPCPKGWKYIDFLTKCVQLLCPPSMVQVGLKCQQLLNKIKGKSLEFRVSSSFSVLDSPPTVNAIQAAASEIISYQEGFQNGKEFFVEMDSTLLPADENWNMFVDVKGTMHLRNLMDVNAIYTQFQSNLEQSMLKSTIVLYQTSLSYVPMPLEGTDFIRFKDSQHFAMTELQFCKAAVFEIENVTEGRPILINGFEISSSDYVIRHMSSDRKFAHVCVDVLNKLDQKYQQLVTRTRSNNNQLVDVGAKLSFPNEIFIIIACVTFRYGAFS